MQAIQREGPRRNPRIEGRMRTFRLSSEEKTRLATQYAETASQVEAVPHHFEAKYLASCGAAVRIRASRSAGCTGFVRSSNSYPCTRVSSSKFAVAAWPEKRRTLKEGRIARTLIAVSIPLMPDIMTSEIRISGVTD